MKQNGFTLLELVIAMSLTAVILGMIVVMTISLNKTLNANNQSVATITDLSQFRSTITTWFRSFDSNEYEVVAGENFAFKLDDTYYSISFEQCELKYKTIGDIEESKKFLNIVSAEFEYNEQNKYLKVDANYGADNHYIFVLYRELQTAI